MNFVDLWNRPQAWNYTQATESTASVAPALVLALVHLQKFPVDLKWKRPFQNENGLALFKDEIPGLKHTSNDENSLMLTAPPLRSIPAPPHQCRHSTMELSIKTTAFPTCWQIDSQPDLEQAVMLLDPDIFKTVTVVFSFFCYKFRSVFSMSVVTLSAKWKVCTFYIRKFMKRHWVFGRALHSNTIIKNKFSRHWTLVLVMVEKLSVSCPVSVYKIIK